MKNIIYYFTGTGNSLALARSLAFKIGCKEVLSIAKVINKKIPDRIDKIGIVCPNYAFNIPHIVRKFIKKIKKTTHVNFIYIVISAGGNNGNAVDKAKKDLKYFPSKAIYTLLMPFNYITFGDIFNQEKERQRIENAKIKITEIAKRIILKENFIDLKIDYHKVALMPGLLYSILYPMISKMDKNFWTSDACNGCAICYRVCPVRNIKMIDKKPFWQHHCEQCFACVHWCPQKSIQYGNRTVNKKRYHHPDIKLKDMILFDHN